MGLSCIIGGCLFFSYILQVSYFQGPHFIGEVFGGDTEVVLQESVEEEHVHPIALLAIYLHLCIAQSFFISLSLTFITSSIRGINAKK